MKIIHFTSHIGQGGDWTIIKSLLESFKQYGHSVLLCSNGANSTSYNSIEIFLNKGVMGFILSLFKIDKLPNDTNIAHVHSPISLIYAICYKYLSCRKLKIIFTYHWQTPDSKLKKILKAILFKAPDAIHSSSQEIDRFLNQEYKVNLDKKYLIYPGVNYQKFRLYTSSDKIALRHKYKIDNETFVLLFVGRLSPEKNISILLNYLANAVNKNITLVVAGDGEQKQELQQRSSTLNVAEKIRFLGRTEQIEEIYALADLLVLPSTSMETFGMVVIEAAFCGLPTLRSDLPGAKDQIEHGKNGFIFSAQQPETMFEILDRIWLERFKLPEIGEKARSQAMDKFTIAKMYENFLNLYQELLESKHPQEQNVIAKASKYNSN